MPPVHKHKYKKEWESIRGVTSTNNLGRMLADKNSTRHRALMKFSIQLAIVST